MQIIKPMALGIGTRCIEHRKRYGLCVSAMIYFPFARDAESATIWTEMGMWNFLGKTMEPPVLDEGTLKTTPEFLVHGHVHAPGGEARSCAFRARVGSREKVLLAHGPRYWQGNSPTQPMPFETLPLDWRYAYGGPALPSNPLGMGHKPEQTKGGKLQRLPCIEYPNARVSRPDQEVAPAGMGVLDPMWPQRAQYRGTYDQKWFEEQSPGLAADTSWRFFNVAPQDQWLEKLSGTEDFEFENLHPTKSIVGGQLPGMVARVFCQLRDEPHGHLKPVNMRPTTAWFFPEHERGVLICQGMLTIKEEDAADVLCLMGAVERLGQPKEDEHYLRAYALRTDPEKAVLYALSDKDLLPEGVKGSDPELDAMQDEYSLKGHMGEARIRNAEVQVELTRAKLKSQGMDPDKLGVKMPPREPTPTVDELPDYLESKRSQIAQHTADALNHAAAQLKQLKDRGINLADVQHRGPPLYRAAEHLQQLMSVVPRDAKKADGSPVIDYDKVGPKLAKAEGASRYSYLMSAHMQPPAPPLTGEVAQQQRQWIIERAARGKKFGGMNLTGADLSGLDLRGTDFGGAQMESVNFCGANLTRCNFQHTVLAHGKFENTVAIRANFRGANLGKALLASAAFDQSNLDDAILMGAKFQRSSFRAASLHRANLLESELQESDWTEAQCTGIHFIKLELRDMTFAAADLQQVNFIECDLSGSDLRSARLAGANFMTCKADRTRFSDADLSNAIFAMGCHLDGADFTRATLRSCNLRGASLAKARLAGALLDESDCSEARLEQADLRQCSAKGALFIKTALRGARASKANWMNAILQRADMRGADLRNSNFFGADLSKLWLDTNSRVDGSNFERARIHPRRAAGPVADREPS